MGLSPDACYVIAIVVRQMAEYNQPTLSEGVFVFFAD